MVAGPAPHAPVVVEGQAQKPEGRAVSLLTRPRIKPPAHLAVKVLRAGADPIALPREPSMPHPSSTEDLMMFPSCAVQNEHEVMSSTRKSFKGLGGVCRPIAA